MFKQTIATSSAPSITITDCLGDLIVRGAEESHVSIRLRGAADDLTLEQEGEELTLHIHSDCTLTCPPDSTLTVETVRGDLKIKEVRGCVTVSTVYGDVILQVTGAIELGQIYGHMNARDIVGDLRVESLSGDARVRGVEGQFSARHIGSDLKAEGVRGGLKTEQIGADAWLGPPFSPGATYLVNAGSDLIAHIPPDADLRLSLQAGGRVRSRIPDLSLEDVGGEMQGTLGDGEAHLKATVGGSVSLRPAEPETGPTESPYLDFATDLEGLGAQIEARISEAMAEIDLRLQESLGGLDSERMRRQIEQVTNHTLERTKRAAERARQAAEREAEQARLRTERAERRWRRVSGQPARPKREPATEEERLRVLRMVEDGKITPEQAAELLAALEGR
ncbi:MAG TPA: hypothetical protein ENN99_00720 [Chloroflexi bacterium]|nr:hypothetical protein [Chloroflexota bacterium]